MMRQNYVNAYISKKLESYEVRTNRADIELASLTYCVTILRQCLWGRKMTCFTDHQSIWYYIDFKNPSTEFGQLAAEDLYSW